MNEFLNNNLVRIIATLIIILLYFIFRYLLKRIIKSYSIRASVSRTSMALIKRTFNFVAAITAIIIIVAVWGVRAQNIFLALSSIFAVIGVALFAQWSILSNITAGLILLLSWHLKIGDTIKISDKDFPVTAEIKDIKLFQIHLTGESGERLVYPNNLLLQKGIAVLYHTSPRDNGQNKTPEVETP